MGIKQILIGVDQLANTLVGGGYADETLSARAWRKRDDPTWGRAHKIIDGIFGKGHCEESWRSEMLRTQLPKGYRDAG